MMANLPTYAEIGIATTWIVTICRMVQGMSSTGEIIGTELYLTEITKPPIQSVSCCNISGYLLYSREYYCVSGSILSNNLWVELALSILDWAGVALLGAIARISLRETTEFVDAKH